MEYEVHWTDRGNHQLHVKGHKDWQSATKHWWFLLHAGHHEAVAFCNAVYGNPGHRLAVVRREAQ